MCGSMADIQYAAAEIRRGKKEEEEEEEEEEEHSQLATMWLKWSVQCRLGAF